MPTITQRSFSGGVLTPTLYARTDINKYLNSLRTGRNAYILKEGGARSRPGSKFIGEVNDSIEVVRLIPFVFSTTQAYLIELGAGYIRFIKDGSHITETAKSITGVTQANPAVVTIASHGYSNGDEVFVTGVVGMTELNNRNFKVANVTTNTFELQDMGGTNLDSTGFGSYSSGGTAARLYQISNSFTEAQLSQVNYVQDADVLTLVHKSHTAKQLSRTSDTNWSLSTFNPTQLLSAPTPSVSGASGTVSIWVVTSINDDGLEGAPNIEAGADTVPSSGSPRTVSWTNVANADRYNVYRKDTNKFSDIVFGFIGEVKDAASSSSLVDDGIAPNYDNNPTSERAENFTDIGTSVNAVTYYQQRFILAGSSSSPETLMASRSGDFDNYYRFDNPITDASPFAFSLVGNQVSEIKHLLDLNGLVIFTQSREIVAQGDSAGTLTPTQVNLRTQSYHGIGDLAPLVIDNTALFVQARGNIIRDFFFSDSVNGYSGNDLTIFSSHFFKGLSRVIVPFATVMVS